MILTIEIPGQPVPYKRVQGSGAHRYTDPKSKAYMTSVRLRCMQAVAKGKRAGGAWSRDVTYGCWLVVVNADERHRDVDNVAKAFLDGATGVLWADDSSVHDLRVVRAPSDSGAPRLVALVRMLAAGEALHEAWSLMEARP